MFEGCDFMMITDELSQMYPGIDFVECYMIPTMRKTMSPDGMMKISLYEAVKKINWEDVHYRSDIGQRALKALDSKDPLNLEYKEDMEEYIEENGVYLRQ